VLGRGYLRSITVVEMPTTRTGPAARSTGRASGCGACGFLCRGVADARSTQPWPPSTLVVYDGTRSSSNPGSPSPVARWNRHWCHGQTT